MKLMYFLYDLNINFSTCFIDFGTVKAFLFHKFIDRKKHSVFLTSF